jgi:hypothetical protein
MRAPTDSLVVARIQGNGHFCLIIAVFFAGALFQKQPSVAESPACKRLNFLSKL